MSSIQSQNNLNCPSLTKSTSMAGFLLKKQYAVITDKVFAIKLLNDPPDRYILFRKRIGLSYSSFYLLLIFKNIIVLLRMGS